MPPFTVRENKKMWKTDSTAQRKFWNKCTTLNAKDLLAGAVPETFCDRDVAEEPLVIGSRRVSGTAPASRFATKALRSFDRTPVAALLPVLLCRTRRESYLTAMDGGNADFAGAKICPGGSSATSLSQTKRQDCGFGRPWAPHSYLRRERSCYEAIT
jgi:hypothetical protein